MKITAPEVTVLMSVYNGERHLREAIDSILNQTFPGFEFLIINDGSTDSSKEIILSYEDSRIRLLNNENNIGLTASLNRGLREAKGKYIARMDADDISYPGRLAAQLNYLKKNPAVGVVSSFVEVINEQGEKLREWSTGLNPEEIYYKLHFRNCLAHGSVMFNKNLVLAAGGYNEKIKRAQDYELWRRLSQVTKIYQLEKVLLKWRDYKTNISYKWKTEQEEVVKGLLKPGIKALAGIEISNRDIELLQKSEVENIKDLNRTIFLLGKINRNLFFKEAEVIQNTGLKKRKIKQAMRAKIKNLLSLFFRKLPPGRFLYCFMKLRFKAKLFLLKEVVSGVKRKIVT